VSRITVDIRKGDITRVKAAAIVNPANSTCSMGEGVSLAIRRAGGEAIEDQAIEQGPIPVGMAIATSAGTLPYRYVVHAASMKRPHQRISSDDIRSATLAAIETADRLGCESLAVPDLGARAGKVSFLEAAREMIHAIESCKTSTLRHVVLIDFEKRMVDAWRKARGGEEEGGDDRRHGQRKGHLPRMQAPLARRRNRHRSFGYGR
jgi:O-acetyl-ADP-ribose deacetylase (regulator of RNase III)